MMARWLVEHRDRRRRGDEGLRHRRLSLRRGRERPTTAGGSCGHDARSSSARRAGSARRSPRRWRRRACRSCARALSRRAHIDLTGRGQHRRRRRTGRDRPTLVIVATGLLHDGERGPEKAMRELDPAWLARQFAVNAIGPALVAKHFLPLMPRTGRTRVRGAVGAGRQHRATTGSAAGTAIARARPRSTSWSARSRSRRSAATTAASSSRSTPAPSTPRCRSRSRATSAATAVHARSRGGAAARRDRRAEAAGQRQAVRLGRRGDRPLGRTTRCDAPRVATRERARDSAAGESAYGRRLRP